MPISLHAAFVPTTRQILGSVLALLDKAEAFCAEKNIEPDVLLGTRLIADMLPLAFQLLRVADHSGGAIVATRVGKFAPEMNRPEPSLAAYRGLLQKAAAELDAVSVEEMESWVGRDMRFEFGTRRMDFTAEDYLLSFAQPNFFFHAATTFDILRSQGLSIGKRDFMGAVRIRG